MKNYSYYEKANKSKLLFYLEYHRLTLATAVLFWIIGIILLYLAVIVSFKDFNFMKYADKTTAIVTYTVGKPEFKTHIKFYHNNMEFRHVLNEWSVLMEEGREVTIYYMIDPDNTIYEILRPSWVIYIIIYICCIISMVGGTVFFIKKVKKSNEEFLKLQEISKRKN